MRIKDNPRGTRLRPLSEAAESTMYHGGIVSSPGPFGNSPEALAKAERAATAFQASIDDGMKALENGTSEFASDAEPMPNAAVEVFDIFDVATGQHHMIWRVPCRDRSAHAN